VEQYSHPYVGLSRGCPFPPPFYVVRCCAGLKIEKRNNEPGAEGWTKYERVSERRHAIRCRKAFYSVPSTPVLVQKELFREFRDAVKKSRFEEDNGDVSTEICHLLLFYPQVVAAALLSLVESHVLPPRIGVRITRNKKWRCKTTKPHQKNCYPFLSRIFKFSDITCPVVEKPARRFAVSAATTAS
jgi:hypothetical protein